MAHDVRIDLKPDDYIDYMTYKPRPSAAPWCCAASAALRPSAARPAASGQRPAANGQRPDAWGVAGPSG